MNHILSLKLFEFSKEKTRPLNLVKKIPFDICLKKKWKFIKIWFNKKKRWKQFKVSLKKLQHKKYFVKRIRGPYKLYMRYVSSFKFCGFHKYNRFKNLFNERVYEKYSQRFRKIFKKYKRIFLIYFIYVNGLSKHFSNKNFKRKRKVFRKNFSYSYKERIAFKRKKILSIRRYKQKKRKFLIKADYSRKNIYKLNLKLVKRYISKNINLILAKYFSKENKLKENRGEYTYSDKLKNSMRDLLRLPLIEEEVKEEGESEDEDEAYKSQDKAAGNITFYNMWITFFHRHNLIELNRIRVLFRKEVKSHVIKHWKYIFKQKIFLILYLYNFYSFRARSILTKSTGNLSYIKEPKILRLNLKKKMVSEKVPELKIEQPRFAAKVNEKTLVAITYREFGAFLLLFKQLYSFLNLNFNKENFKIKKKDKETREEIDKKIDDLIADFISRIDIEEVNRVAKKDKGKSLNSIKLIKENPFFLKYNIGSSLFEDYIFIENIFSTQNILAPRLIRYLHDYLVELPLSRKKVKRMELSKKKVYIRIPRDIFSKVKITVRHNVDHSHKSKGQYRFCQYINYKKLKKEVLRWRNQDIKVCQWLSGFFKKRIPFYETSGFFIFRNLSNSKLMNEITSKFILAFHEKIYIEHIINNNLYKNLFTPYNIWIFFFNYALNYYLLSKLFFSFLNYLFYIILEKFLRISYTLRIKNLELCYDFMKLGDNSRYYLGIRPHTFITTFNRRVQRGSLLRKF